jgi:hypothetical protein
MNKSKTNRNKKNEDQIWKIKKIKWDEIKKNILIL